MLAIGKFQGHQLFWTNGAPWDTVPGQMASLPPPDRALLMTFYIVLKHISRTWTYRKVKIKNCMKTENLNIYHSWEWSQHGFTCGSQRGPSEKPARWIWHVCPVFYYLLLFFVNLLLLFCMGFLDYTSAVPLSCVIHRPMNYVRVSDVYIVVGCFFPLAFSGAAHHAIKAAFHRNGGWMKSAKSFAVWVSVVLSSFALVVVSRSSRRPWPWSGYVKLRTLKVTEWRQLNLEEVSCSKRRFLAGLPARMSYSISTK